MKRIQLTMLLVLFSGLTMTAIGQTFGGPPSFTPDVLDNPIDGGLSVLLGAGAAFGFKKLRDFQKSKKQDKSES